MNEEDADFSELDYKKLIKAMFDSALVDYTKLQNSKNRHKKYLEESFQNSIDMFFNPTFIFEHFLDADTQTKNLNFEQLLCYLLNTNKVDMTHIHNHIAEESMSYWWDKNFHDLAVPSKITIHGIVWTVVNSPNNSYIDYTTKRIYCPKKAILADRNFISLCLKIMLDSIEVELDDNSVGLLSKTLYLFLKINSPFEKRKK